MTGSSQSPEALKKEEGKANAFVRRTNTVKKANGLALRGKKGRRALPEALRKTG
jgi:hypothetical protein